MKEFLEKSLRQQVTIMEDKELYKKFPLVYRGRYDIFKVETNGVVWMAIYPKDNVGLIMLRRDRAKVEKITGLNCAIFLDRTTFYIKEKLLAQLELYPDADIYITQGFICRNAYGSIDNLERGGSDYTASLIGAAIQAEEIQIWTDIDGMHNNDPRFVNDTVPVRQLNFDEAAKLAHFGAKILHPTCILPAKEKNIPVRLLNALQPSASGTLISNTAEKGAIKAVAAKDNITYVKIKSLHMIPTPHFLSIVFDTFYNYNTPVDMVTTSDIGVSVAIDNDKHIDEIVGVLREYATITVEKNMVIVCVVGDLEWQNVGFEARIINALKDIPVRMISYGGSSSNVSLVMKAEDKVHALKALSEHLFSVSDKPVLSSVS